MTTEIRGSGDDIVFVMPPLKPLTGVAAPAKKRAMAAKPPASQGAKPAEQKPAAFEGAVGGGPLQAADTTIAATAEPQAPVSQSAPVDLPTIAVNASIAVEEWNAPARAFGWETAGLQSGPAPSFVPPLDPAGETAQETAAAEPTAEAETESRSAAPLPERLIGPAEVRLADRATMQLPAGRVFIPMVAARKLAREVGLEWRAGIQGFVAPADGGLDWLAPVELLDDGHINAEDAGSLDADKVLAAFRESLSAVNARRVTAGQPAAALEGWLAPPALDAGRRLSACVMVTTVDPSAPGRFFNCDAWALGREGAIRIGLVEGAEKASPLKDEMSALAGKIVFDSGKTYEDFDAAADRVAPYGAADLLVHDLSLKTVAPPGTVAEGDAKSFLDPLAMAFAALFGAAAFLLYVRMKPRGPKAGPSDPSPSRAESQAAESQFRPGAKTPPLFARLLPTLHARLARKRGPMPVESPASLGLAQEQEATAAISPSGTREKMQAAPKDSRASPANDAEESISALRKFALRMRRSPEPQPVAVDPGRVLRRRSVGGAAPAYQENLDLGPAIYGDVAGKASEAEQFSAVEESEAALDQDALGLIEPGDAAASSAINAARNRQMLDEQSPSRA